ncbi:MAG: hypothetical protein MJB14_03185 [Spirochaetes bacterium]|nr:hypothetical protein [Spirochaetota bacterium]
MKKTRINPQRLPQDLHIHTAFSSTDSSIVPEMTLDLIAAVGHAKNIGISDHLDSIAKDETFQQYIDAVRTKGFYLGVEVDGGKWSEIALQMNTDYIVYHCYDRSEDYQAIDHFLGAGKPVIIAHPYALETNLSKVPLECFIEINNRYIWKYDWQNYFKNISDKQRFIINSDAHQPNWLNQQVARYVAYELGINETLLFNRELAFI